jgi:ABC-type branched-subunit amino acid transport system substrate-binding protein
MRLRTRPALLLRMGAAILVAAATSCTPSGAASDASAACDSPGVTPTQVTLGFVYPDSGGSSSALAAARAGLDARIGLANEDGGVHGRRIVYEWRSDESSTSVAAVATRDLVQHDRVFGLVTASASLGDSMNSLTEQGVPVTGIAIEPAWAGRDNMFSFIYSASPVVVGRYLRAAHATRVAVIDALASAVSDQNTKSYEQGLQAAGIGTVKEFSYTAGLDDPAAVALKIKSFGADALLGITAPADFAQVVQATRAAGTHLVASVVLTGYDRGVLAQDGAALAGVSMPVFFRPFEAGGAAIESYEAAMARYAPEAGQPDQQFAMFAYISTDLFLEGLDRAGPCPTRAGFIKALRSVSAYDAGGLVAPVDLRDYSGRPVSCYAFVQVTPTGAAFDVASQRVCADGKTG